MADEQITLRDEIAAQFDAHEETTPPTEIPPQEPPAASSEPQSAPDGETAEQKAGRLAGRARDDRGRVLPGKAKPLAKPNAAEPADVGTQPPQEGAGQAAAPPAAPKLPRPSTWKKEHWEDWAALAESNPKLAAYLQQREREYANGVSTYKQEWEQARPLLDAVAPFMPQLQQHGIDPGQWITNLGQAHHNLATGSPQAKLEMFQRLAQDYGIPAQLAVQNAEGEWQLLAAPAPRAPQQQQPQQNQYAPQQLEQVVERMLEQKQMQREVEQFTTNTEKYPYVEQVRETMAGLLQAGLAENLPEAYEAALRHPRHADIYEEMQQQQSSQDDATRREAERVKAEKARAKSISPRSSSPSGPPAKPGARELRDEISAAFDTHISGSRM